MLKATRAPSPLMSVFLLLLAVLTLRALSSLASHRGSHATAVRSLMPAGLAADAASGPEARSPNAVAPGSEDRWAPVRLQSRKGAVPTPSVTPPTEVGKSDPQQAPHSGRSAVLIEATMPAAHDVQAAAHLAEAAALPLAVFAPSPSLPDSSRSDPAPIASTGAAALVPPVVRRTDLSLVRTWARNNGYTVADRGRVAAAVLDAYDRAH